MGDTTDQSSSIQSNVDEKMNNQSQIIDDEKLQRQKEIDAWLPITGSRNAKWWYSAFHNVTSMVGAGVKVSPLPCPISDGTGPGCVILVLSWVITLFTLWQMVEMHEMVPGKRFDRYHDLGQHAFGEKLGLWIMVPQQLICEVGVDIVYMVTGGKSLQKVYKTVKKDKDPIKLTYFIMIFASAHFVLAHLPNFYSISGVSLARSSVQPDVAYGYKSGSTPGTVFNFFTALGDVAFAYAGHDVPSKKPMWRGVVLAYIVVVLCYFPDNIFISLEKPEWLIITANLFVVVHVIGSYQLFAMPVFDMVETLLVKKLHFRPTLILRFVSQNIYVGFAFSPTTYFLPCIMWLAIKKPRKFSLPWIINWICITLDVMLMILSPIGGLRSIIVQASTYKFYD
ncbi:lysine histidine transporter 1-like [Pyrus ussuriensis x Pyrus communis]|uniref:Lysine histidine transporter 1-like n=1 Tax=Pyrus ussuriensis x Pyrus communis TaxID=2448454 RepID=A0A5N5GKF1_9ROSA|nr:lysine histidine transporter 1-like [Pyrus ussuriensis x Pyrus communis]